jgi:hypothetical protein
MIVLALGGGVSLFMGFGGGDCAFGDGDGVGRLVTCFPGAEASFDDEAVAAVVE